MGAKLKSLGLKVSSYVPLSDLIIIEEVYKRE